MAAGAEEILLTLADKFIADVEATTPLRPTCSRGRSRGETAEWERLVFMLHINRSGAGAGVERWLLREQRFADILVHMADEWSETVGEELIRVAGVEAARTWPRCPRHDHSMDPVVEAGRALWACRDDRSLRVPIGQLANPKHNDSADAVRNL